MGQGEAVLRTKKAVEAIKAAKFIAGKLPGLYTMQDVLL